jgi:hypothetical protein
MNTNNATAVGLDTLKALLSSARGLVDQIGSEPLLGRILAAFAMLPQSDREPILRVLERDAAWRRIVEETSGGSGITVRPNPHASLYLHVSEQVENAVTEDAPSQRDIDMIRLGIMRFVRLFPLFFQEGVHAQWTVSARELIRAADPELRALGTRLAREVLALIEEAEAESLPKRVR